MNPLAIQAKFHRPRHAARSNQTIQQAKIPRVVRNTGFPSLHLSTTTMELSMTAAPTAAPCSPEVLQQLMNTIPQSSRSASPGMMRRQNSIPSPVHASPFTSSG